MYNRSNNQKLDQKKCTYETKLGFAGPFRSRAAGRPPCALSVKSESVLYACMLYSCFIVFHNITERREEQRKTKIQR